MTVKKYLKESIKLGDKELTVETGRVAKQADGSVVIRYGDTMLLVAAVGAPTAREGIDFFPLTVEYRESNYAAGRIPGNYFRREGRPNEKEVLTSRLIDRPCRPLFAEGYQKRNPGNRQRHLSRSRQQSRRDCHHRRVVRALPFRHSVS